MISYQTGRTYDGEQVLQISVESESIDEYGLSEVVATFVDPSRHIRGRVEVIVFNDGIGAAVLSAYDAGRYDALTYGVDHA